MTEKFVWFSIIAPWWRAPCRPIPGLGGQRRWLRWQVVEETRPVFDPAANNPVVSSYAHHSLHWTYRSAWNAARDAAARAEWMTRAEDVR